MNLILDTHIAIWFVTDSDKLPESEKHNINLIWDLSR